MQCPVCRGTGKRKIRMKPRFVGGRGKKRTRYLECVWCDGRGEVSIEDYEAFMNVIKASEVTSAEVAASE